MTAFAPGSVGNLICGFDVLGAALERPGDRVTAVRTEESGVVIGDVRGDDGRIPREVDRNSAGAAVVALLESRPAEGGVRLDLEKGLPLSGGMGGSAASAVAAVIAVDALLGLEADEEVLLASALEGERAASGSAHADNVAPSLRGGIVLVGRPGERSPVSLPVPDELAVAVLHPHIEIETREARALVPDPVPLADAVEQWGATAALVAALFREDWDLLAESLVDRIAEPARAEGIPAFARMRSAAVESGAVGFGISGAGPSVVAVCRGRERAREVGERVLETFRARVDSRADLYVSGVPRKGARVIRSSDEEAA